MALVRNLSRVKNWGAGEDCVVETALEVGTMRENGIFVSKNSTLRQKASEHMQNGAWALWEQCIIR